MVKAQLQAEMFNPCIGAAWHCKGYMPDCAYKREPTCLGSHGTFLKSRWYHSAAAKAVGSDNVSPLCCGSGTSHCRRENLSDLLMLAHKEPSCSQESTNLAEATGFAAAVSQ